jgi:hypothetical protein
LSVLDPNYTRFNRHRRDEEQKTIDKEINFNTPKQEIKEIEYKPESKNDSF